MPSDVVHFEWASMHQLIAQFARTLDFAGNCSSVLIGAEQLPVILLFKYRPAITHPEIIKRLDRNIGFSALTGCVLVSTPFDESSEENFNLAQQKEGF